MMRSAALTGLIALCIAAPLAASAQRYVTDEGTMGSSPKLLYRLTFNITAPFGTDESESSTDGCLTHGADATTAAGKHRCQLAAGGCTGVPEGDACMQVFSAAGDGKLQTDWFAAWNGVADTWIRLHVLFFDFADGTPEILGFRNGAAGDPISFLGYKIDYSLAGLNRLVVSCGSIGSATNWDSAFVQNTWAEWVIHINTDDGLLEVYVDGAITPTKTCNGTGGDSATPVDGFRAESHDNKILTRMDDIRFYDGDPR